MILNSVTAEEKLVYRLSVDEGNRRHEGNNWMAPGNNRVSAIWSEFSSTVKAPLKSRNFRISAPSLLSPPLLPETQKSLNFLQTWLTYFIP